MSEMHFKFRPCDTPKLSHFTGSLNKKTMCGLPVSGAAPAAQEPTPCPVCEAKLSAWKAEHGQEAD